MSLAPISAQQRKFVEDSIQLDLVKLKLKSDQLVEWMKKQPHLPQLPDNFAQKLARIYLIGAKLSTEKAKSKIDAFYSLRHQLTDLFLKLDPLQKEVKDSLESVLYFPLTELTTEGNRIHINIFRPDKSQGEYFKDIKGFCKRIINIQLGRFLQDELCGGDVMVFDCRAIRLSLITELDWSMIHKFLVFCQEGLPFRPKMVIFINAPGFIETILNIIKPALKEKLRNRIQVFHGDHTNLYKFMPQRILPLDYGGETPSLKECSSAWQNTIESMRDFLLEDEKRLTDELKRPKDSVNKHSQVFGVNGTFTKLTID